jgi:hypothetical protein
MSILTLGFGDHVVKISSVFQCQKRFMDGREFVANRLRSGKPETQNVHTNVSRALTLFPSHRRLDVKLLAQEV